MVINTNRYRARNDARVSHATVQLSDGFTVHGDIPFYTYQEEISDCVNRKVRGHYKPSNVVHIKHKVDLKPLVGGKVADGRSFTAIDHPFPIVPADVDRLLPVVPDGLWMDLCLEAFNSFSTQIPTDVSIANFTWELRELGELIPKFMQSLSKTVAGGYLTYQFGWKPFVSDCQKLGSMFSYVADKIKHLVDTWGKRTRLSLVRPRVIDDFILIPQLENAANNPNAFLGLAGHRADFQAHGRLYHTLEGLNTMYGDIRAFISALGLNNPVKAFWDAIPASFIAGWFTRVGRHLDTLAVNPFKGVWQVDNLSFSMKERIVLYGYHDTEHSFGTRYEAGRVEIERYTRLDGFPIGVSSFNLHDLNPSQQTLLGALIVGHT